MKGRTVSLLPPECGSRQSPARPQVQRADARFNESLHIDGDTVGATE